MAKLLLSPEDPDIIIAFKTHGEKFLALLEAGVFHLESGKVELNINNKQIQSVFIHKQAYKRKADELPTAIKR